MARVPRVIHRLNRSELITLVIDRLRVVLPGFQSGYFQKKFIFGWSEILCKTTLIVSTDCARGAQTEPWLWWSVLKSRSTEDAETDARKDLTLRHYNWPCCRFRTVQRVADLRKSVHTSCSRTESPAWNHRPLNTNCFALSSAAFEWSPTSDSRAGHSHIHWHCNRCTIVRWKTPALPPAPCTRMQRMRV